MLSGFTRFRIQVVVATFLTVLEQPLLPEMSCDLLMPVALDRLAFGCVGTRTPAPIGDPQRPTDWIGRMG
jgi:hypothetical protein